MNVCCWIRAGVLLAAVGVFFAGGCWSSPPPRITAPGIASDAAQKALETYDTDKNGSLNPAELDKAPGLKAAFPRSSTVTADDIAARIEEWNKSKMGRMSITIRLQHNGQPLKDATVTVVPESFLGSEMQSAAGKTDDSGVANVTVPVSGPNDVPGVAPGFYRVQVTKSGENIPGKYNTQTILGVQVPPIRETRDAFDLQY